MTYGERPQETEEEMSNLYSVEMFENSRGSFTVIKVEKISNTVTDYVTFADKNAAIAFAIENGWKVGF